MQGRSSAWLRHTASPFLHFVAGDVRVCPRTLRCGLHRSQQAARPGCPLHSHRLLVPPFQLISGAFDEGPAAWEPSTHSSQRAPADWPCVATTPRSSHFTVKGTHCMAPVAVWSAISGRTPRLQLRRHCAPSSARDTTSSGCAGYRASQQPAQIPRSAGPLGMTQRALAVVRRSHQLTVAVPAAESASLGCHRR
jgi:hypothetical protein